MGTYQIETDNGEVYQIESDADVSAMSPSQINSIIKSGSTGQEWSIPGMAGEFGKGVLEGTASLGGLVLDASTPGLIYNKITGRGPLGFSEELQQGAQEYIPANPNHETARFAGTLMAPGNWSKKPILEAAKVLLGAVGGTAAQELTGNNNIAPIIGAMLGSASASGGAAAKNALIGASEAEIRGSAANTFRNLTGLDENAILAARANAPEGLPKDFRTIAELTGNAPVAQIEKTLGGSTQFSNEYNAIDTARNAERTKVLDSLSAIKGVNREALGGELINKGKDTQKEMEAAARAEWAQFSDNIEIEIPEDVRTKVAQMVTRKKAGLPIDSQVQTIAEDFAGVTRKKKTSSPTLGIGTDQASQYLSEVVDAGILTKEKADRLLAMYELGLKNKGWKPNEFESYPIEKDPLYRSMGASTVENAFFEAGRTGSPIPQYKSGYRYGHGPIEGNSVNRTTNTAEQGISLAAVDGETPSKSFAAMQDGRKKHDLTGWVLSHTRGSDGEALMVNEGMAIRANKPFRRKEITEEVIEIDPKLRTTGELQELRSEALDQLRKRDRDLSKRMKSILVEVEQGALKSIENGLGPAAAAVYERARAATAKEKGTFARGTAGGTLLQKTTRESNALANVMKGDKRSIRELKAAIGNDKDLLEKTKRGVLDMIPRGKNDTLTASGVKRFLAANEGAVEELFGADGLNNVKKIADDLSSAENVHGIAWKASDRGSPTSQKTTVAGEIGDMIGSALIPDNTLLGRLIRTLREGTSIKEKAKINEYLFKAAMDPEFAADLAAAPNTVRTLKAMERLVQMSKEGVETGARAGIVDDRLTSALGLEGSTEQKTPARTPANKPLSTPTTSPTPLSQVVGRVLTQDPSANDSVNSSVNQVNYTQALDQGGDVVSSLFGDEKTMIDDTLVKAVIQAESSGNPSAVSNKGAKGLMQLLDPTFKEEAGKLGLKDADIMNPDHNVAVGTSYLNKLVKRYDGDVRLALAAYNWGMGNLGKVLKKGKTFEDIEQSLPKETRNYVAKIMKNVELA